MLWSTSLCCNSPWPLVRCVLAADPHRLHLPVLRSGQWRVGHHTHIRRHPAGGQLSRIRQQLPQPHPLHVPVGELPFRAGPSLLPARRPTPDTISRFISTQPTLRATEGRRLSWSRNCSNGVHSTCLVRPCTLPATPNIRRHISPFYIYSAGQSFHRPTEDGRLSDGRCAARATYVCTAGVACDTGHNLQLTVPRRVGGWVLVRAWRATPEQHGRGAGSGWTDGRTAWRRLRRGSCPTAAASRRRQSGTCREGNAGETRRRIRPADSTGLHRA